ncbi:MAG: transposase [Kribbellaceae bacterium]|jgi:transposase|nr:transposase [Kribbellaceae bacterium]
MTTTTIEVTGGVDTHRDTHHAAALDQVGRLLGTQEFPAEPAGYRQLLTWLESFGTLTRIGVEGTGCYGAGLTRFLRRRRLRVIEVNRPDRRSRRLRGKSDRLDAESAARRALAGEDQVIPKDTTTIVEAIRVLRIARSGAVKSRTAAYNQLKDLIVTAPDELRQTLRGKSLPRVAAESARLRPDLTRLDDPTHANKLALRSIAVRIDALGSEIAGLDKQLHQLVALAAPRTLSLLGVGPDHAAQLLITAGGNPERLRSEAAFAALCAASPIPVSSGKTNRHRLNRAGGDRGANRALYMIIVTRLRYCPDTQAYIKRRIAEGLTKPEAIRCVKRYVARQTYHAVRADLAAATGA